MNNDEKWTYRLENDEQGVWMHDTYKTKDEAIKKGIEQAKECNAKEISIGKTVQDVLPNIDADDVISDIQDNMYDAYGDFAEDYLDYVKTEEIKELDNKLNAVLQEWLENNNLEPNFYHIIEVEKLEVR